LTDAQEEELKSADVNQVNSLNRIIRKTIHPAIGDKGSMHAVVRALEYHILFKKPFDIVDMMFEKMENNHRHRIKRMPYAPYIMLLINSATMKNFVPESGGNECVEHKKHKMENTSNKQPKDQRASKSQSMRVPSEKSKSMRVPKMNSVATDSVNLNSGRIPTIQECINLVESVEGLTLIEKADASELMRLDLAAREALMSFSNEQVCLVWIKKRLGPVNNPGTA
jgi:hypothetical protein